MSPHGWWSRQPLASPRLAAEPLLPLLTADPSQCSCQCWWWAEDFSCRWIGALESSCGTLSPSLRRLIYTGTTLQPYTRSSIRDGRHSLLQQSQFSWKQELSCWFDLQCWIESISKYDKYNLLWWSQIRLSHICPYLLLTVSHTYNDEAVQHEDFNRST